MHDSHQPANKNMICRGATSLRNSQICVDATVFVAVLQSMRDLSSPHVASVFNKMTKIPFSSSIEISRAALVPKI